MRVTRVMRVGVVVLSILLLLSVVPLSASAWQGTPAIVVGAPLGLRIRQAPNLASAVVRSVHNGQTVYVMDGPFYNQGIAWSLIRVYHGPFYSQGYCASSYLSTGGGSVPSGEHGLMVSAPSGLRLRSAPGIWSATRRIVPYGTVLHPTGGSQWAGGILWTQVAFDGIVAWAAGMYLVAV